MDLKLRLLVISIILILIGCAGKAFEQAQSVNTVEAYNQFLKDYGDSEYAKRAKKLREKAFYKRSIKYDTIDSYNNYLKKFPNGRFVSEIKTAREKKWFNNVKKENSIKSYDSYLNEYPNGQFVNEVKEAKEKLWFNNAEKMNTTDSYRGYLKEYPEGKFIDKVNQLIIKAIEVKLKKHNINKIMYTKDSKKVIIQDIENDMAITDQGNFSLSDLQKVAYKANGYFIIDTKNKNPVLKDIKIINSLIFQDQPENIEEADFRKIPQICQALNLYGLQWRLPNKEEYAIGNAFDEFEHKIYWSFKDYYTDIYVTSTPKIYKNSKLDLFTYKFHKNKKPKKNYFYTDSTNYLYRCITDIPDDLTDLSNKIYLSEVSPQLSTSQKNDLMIECIKISTTISIFNALKKGNIKICKAEYNEEKEVFNVEICELPEFGQFEIPLNKKNAKVFEDSFQKRSIIKPILEYQIINGKTEFLGVKQIRDPEYLKLENKFENAYTSYDDLQKIIKEFPDYPRIDEAKNKLKQLEHEKTKNAIKLVHDIWAKNFPIESICKNGKPDNEIKALTLNITLKNLFSTNKKKLHKAICQQTKTKSLQNIETVIGQDTNTIEEVHLYLVTENDCEFKAVLQKKDEDAILTFKDDCSESIKRINDPLVKTFVTLIDDLKPGSYFNNKKYKLKITLKDKDYITYKGNIKGIDIPEIVTNTKKGTIKHINLKLVGKRIEEVLIPIFNKRYGKSKISHKDFILNMSKINMKYDNIKFTHNNHDFIQYSWKNSKYGVSIEFNNELVFKYEDGRTVKKKPKQTYLVYYLQ